VHGTSESLKVSGPLVSGGRISLYFRFSPDGARVLYVGSQESVDQEELFATFDDVLLTPTPTATLGPTATATVVTTPLPGDNRSYVPVWIFLHEIKSPGRLVT
jgi:hypothetical protein